MDCFHSDHKFCWSISEVTIHMIRDSECTHFQHHQPTSPAGTVATLRYKNNNFVDPLPILNSMAHSNGRPPVLLLSHGTTLLTGEQSHIRDYWQQHGEKALTYGIKGVIIMVCRLTTLLTMLSNRMIREPIGTFLEEKYMWPRKKTPKFNL